MQRPEELMRENEALRERLSRLSEASLRITEDLDIDAVLRGVLDSARSLTGALYGVMTPLDDRGEVQDLLSSGMTAEEADQLQETRERSQHLAYLRDIPGPLRVADLREYFRSLGLPEPPIPLDMGPVVSYLAVPVTHRGLRVGNIYLAGKEGGREFTQEDEDTLVMFASLSAMAITNARRHRDELRARADMETLIDISPVGVVVFDAITGAPKSFNREAWRIVDRLREPDQPTEQLLEIVTCVRADGRQISLRESPMAELLSTGETVRAEEIVMHVPGGRSVTVLLNATPIRSDQGEVMSVVVTMQDMADMEELERLRADFLAMVSHELRTPLTSIRGSAFTILDAGPDLDPAVARQFVQIIWEQVEHMNDLVAGLLDMARIETGTLPVSPEPAEVAVLVDRARNAFISAGGRNNLEVDVEPGLPMVSADRRRIVQVIGNLLSNAARNSPESSVIRVTAARRDVHVAVSVADEGRGIPAEGLPLLFRKFSRVQADEQGGDTGLGLSICKGIVEAHGGRIWAESDGLGMGARFTFTLPTIEDTGSGTSPILLPVSKREREDTGERVRILAVDDEPQALRYVRDTLAKSGYQPVVTGEPEEALRLMAEERPELVLLDLMLPGTDGIELMQGLSFR